MQRVWKLERAVAALDVVLVDLHSDGWLPEGTQGWSKFLSHHPASVDGD